ncbi:MAG: hypothetical protein SVX43_13565 [Cyanobacteriota bacterium]|nr:hypothetical protein [Cyanobacteriota bacterium]
MSELQRIDAIAVNEKRSLIQVSATRSPQLAIAEDTGDKKLPIKSRLSFVG